MHVVDPGHVYELASLDGALVQRLQFVKREGPRYPGNGGHHVGTTMQEVLRALIDRASYVDHQIPSWWTRAARGLMVLAVWLLEARAALRHGRVPPGISRAVWGSACAKCGHVGCQK